MTQRTQDTQNQDQSPSPSIEEKYEEIAARIDQFPISNTDKKKIKTKSKKILKREKTKTQLFRGNFQDLRGILALLERKCLKHGAIWPFFGLFFNQN